MLLICIRLVGSIALAVEAAGPEGFEELLDAVYSRGEGEVIYEALQEQLWECYHTPLVLNQASREDLGLLCILTDDQLDELFKHIEKNGPLISIYELQAIPAFDLPTIQLLLPFVRVVEAGPIKRNVHVGHKEVISRDNYSLFRCERILEPQKGYQYNRKKHGIPYTGSPNKLFARHRIKHPSGWELGLSTRKRAGEAWVWDPATRRYGLAPCRFHWLLKDRNKVKTLLIGDYAVGYGQGVVLNAGFSVDKSSETTQVTRTNNLGIRPHTSAATIAFRGVATTWQWHPLSLTLYYSNVNLDGKVRAKAPSGNPYVSHVSRGGYYRTQNEIAQKGRVNEQVAGCTLIYTGPARSSELGINVLYNRYSLPIYPDTRRKNPLSFRGQNHANGSFFYRYLWKNFHCFGEGALSKDGGKAAIAGVVASLSRHTSATVLWRHYGQRFHSPHGKAFRENASSNSNERGIYLGVGARPLPHLYLDTYYDYFYFPWCLGRPRVGYSWLAKASYQLTKASRMYFQYKITTKPRGDRRVQVDRAAVGTQQHYKFHWQYQWGRSASFKSEVQCSRYQQLGVPTWGYAAAQSIAYRLRKFQLKGHVVWFSANNYSNRLYFYEPNMLYAGSQFRPYYGRGTRYCCLVCYRPTAAFRLELKYALTRYQNRNEIGSGYEATRGNMRNEVMMQAFFRF